MLFKGLLKGEELFEPLSTSKSILMQDFDVNIKSNFINYDDKLPLSLFSSVKLCNLDFKFIAVSWFKTFEKESAYRFKGSIHNNNYYNHY